VPEGMDGENPEVSSADRCPPRRELHGSCTGHRRPRCTSPNRPARGEDAACPCRRRT
jgi:hypothetical protein